MKDRIDFRPFIFVLCAIYIIILTAHFNCLEIWIYIKELITVVFIHTVAQEHLSYIYEKKDIN